MVKFIRTKIIFSEVFFRLELAILCLLLSGCGVHVNDEVQGSASEHIPVTVDASLMPYMTKFESDIGVITSGISAGFYTLTAPTVGQCVEYSNGDKAIQVDVTYWSTASADTREQLMYHELGHCAMGLGHIPDLNSSNCPVSIMYPNKFGFSPCYTNNKPYYYSELASHK